MSSSAVPQTKYRKRSVVPLRATRVRLSREDEALLQEAQTALSETHDLHGATPSMNGIYSMALKFVVLSIRQGRVKDVVALMR